MAVEDKYLNEQVKNSKQIKDKLTLAQTALNQAKSLMKASDVNEKYIDDLSGASEIINQLKGRF